MGISFVGLERGMSMAEKKIEDFGEKIGGARKDLYALNRELRYGDILDWNDMEKEKYITKKEAFPLPDYKKMLEEGKDREVIFFIKKVRDSLPTKPLAAIPYLASAEQRKDIIDTAQRDYLLTVNRFYEKAMSLTSLSECARFYDEIKSENLPDTNCFNRKLIKATDLGGRLGLYQFRRELENKQFLFSEDEKILSNFSFYRYDGQNVTKEEYREGKERLVIHESGCSTYIYNFQEAGMTDLSAWQNDTYFVLQKNDREIVAVNLQDRDAAVEEALKIGKEQNPEKKKKTKRKTRLKPPQLENIRPTAEDYRGGMDITGDDMMHTFGFRAGEFGNWNNNNDRQTNLNMSFDAFKDLAKALNIKDEDIALGGKLAIAYGARGSGSALAHFEPSANVINLTKMRGAGSLAHEWGHALDLYVARAYNMDSSMATGASYSEIRQGKAPFKELMDTIKYKNNERTEYYKNAEKLDTAFSKTDQGYWRSDVELFARAFASYVHDKLPANTSDYLVGHSEMIALDVQDGNTVQIPTSPQDKEREAINQAFDKALESLKEKEILHHYVREEKKEVKKPEKEETKTAGRAVAKKRYYTNEESERMTDWLKEHISVVDVCQSLGYSPVRVGQKYYSLKEHDSVRIDLQKNCFYWNSRGRNGSVIDACIAFGDMEKADAYNHLYHMAGGREAVFEAAVGNQELEVKPVAAAKQKHPEKKEKENLKDELPKKAAHMRNVYAYLGKTRQIDGSVINEFVKRQMLYQDDRNNCVFVSRNKEGEPVFACMRGTNTYKRFVADVKGSDYSKGFYVNNQADKLFVGESVIDIMSKMTLLKKDGVDYHDYNYLAMAGTQKQEAIEYVLDNNRQIKEIYLGMDNDAGGLKAAKQLEESLSGRNIVLKRDMPDKSGYDWNDMLCFQSKDVSQKENEYTTYTKQHKEKMQDLKTDRTTIVINAFGGPGSGKTTSCMNICAELKKQGFNAEYVQEYAKELVYDKNFEILDGSKEHQFEILKEQVHRMDRLIGKTDFIVTDSPILLNTVYNQQLTPEYERMVSELSGQYQNFSFFMKRDDSQFQTEGRIHDLQESKQKDKEIKSLLKKHKVYYGTYDHETVDVVVQNAIANFRRLQKDEKGKEDVQKNLEPTKEADSPEAQNINIFENHGKDKTDIFSMVKDKTKDTGIWKDAPKVRQPIKMMPGLER